MLSDEEKKAIRYLKIYITQDVLYDNSHYKQIETLLNRIEKQESKIKNAIDFINNDKNYFEDGENWENVLKIKEILEGKDGNR